jgi:hypothetical protein
MEGTYDCPKGPQGVKVNIINVPANSEQDCQNWSPVKRAFSDLVYLMSENPNGKKFGPSGNKYCRVTVFYTCEPKKKSATFEEGTDVDDWTNDITHANRRSVKMKLKRNLWWRQANRNG